MARYRRYTMIGLATLGGGAVLGLTGGLAAPFIGAGLGSLLGAGEHYTYWGWPGRIEQTVELRRWGRGGGRDIAICGSLSAHFNF